MVTLKVEGVFYLESKQSTCIFGEIINGSISAGMSVNIGGEWVKINGVGFLDRNKESANYSKTGLLVKSDRSLCEKLIKKPLIGEELELVPIRIC